jgi:hypothetical protein
MKDLDKFVNYIQETVTIDLIAHKIAFAKSKNWKSICLLKYRGVRKNAELYLNAFTKPRVGLLSLENMITSKLPPGYSIEVEYRVRSQLPECENKFFVWLLFPDYSECSCSLL